MSLLVASRGRFRDHLIDYRAVTISRGHGNGAARREVRQSGGGSTPARVRVRRWVTRCPPCAAWPDGRKVPSRSNGGGSIARARCRGRSCRPDTPARSARDRAGAGLKFTPPAWIRGVCAHRRARIRAAGGPARCVGQAGLFALVVVDLALASERIGIVPFPRYLSDRYYTLVGHRVDGSLVARWQASLGFDRVALVDYLPPN